MTPDPIRQRYELIAGHLGNSQKIFPQIFTRLPHYCTFASSRKVFYI